MEWSARFKLASYYKLAIYVPENLSKEYKILPVTFRKERRIVHYSYLNEALLNHGPLSFNEKAPEKLQKYLNEQKSNWSSSDLHLQGLIKLGDIPDIEIPKDKAPLKIEQAEKLMHFLFRLVSPPTIYEVGIVYKIMQNQEKSTPSRFFYMQPTENGKQDKKYRSIRKGNLDASKEMMMKHKDKMDKMDMMQLNWSESEPCEKEYGLHHLKEIREKLYGPLLDSLLLENSSTGSSETKNAFGSLSRLEHACLIFPIFDIYIGNKGYGGIQGFYSVYKKDEGEWNEGDKKNKIVEEFSPYLTILSDAIFTSNLLRTTEIELYLSNIINIFLKMISCVQDWENIWLTKKCLKDILKDIKSKEDIVSHWGRNIVSHWGEIRITSVQKIGLLKKYLHLQI